MELQFPHTEIPGPARSTSADCIATIHPWPIDVWLIDHVRSPIRVSDALADLSPMERRHVDAIPDPGVRRLKTLSRSAVKRILARYLDGLPREIGLTANRYGKPQLPHTPIHLSVSHSGDFTAVAVSVGTPVGIDLEIDRSVPDYRDLAGSAMSPGERKVFNSFARLHRERRFLELWTRKEAVLKYQGIGLMQDPRDLDVGWTSCTVRTDEETLLIAEIDFGTDFLCTLCAGHNFRINFRGDPR